MLSDAAGTATLVILGLVVLLMLGFVILLAAVMIDDVFDLSQYIDDSEDE